MLPSQGQFITGVHSSKASGRNASCGSPCGCWSNTAPRLAPQGYATRQLTGATWPELRSCLDRFRHRLNTDPVSLVPGSEIPVEGPKPPIYDHSKPRTQDSWPQGKDGHFGARWTDRVHRCCRDALASPAEPASEASSARSPADLISLSEKAGEP